MDVHLRQSPLAVVLTGMWLPLDATHRRISSSVRNLTPRYTKAAPPFCRASSHGNLSTVAPGGGSPTGGVLYCQLEVQPATCPDKIFLGKWLDLEAREIRSHPRAFLQTFHVWVRIACTPRPSSRLLPKVLGFL